MTSHQTKTHNKLAAKAATRKVIHILCGKVCGKVRGKGWEKSRKTLSHNGEKWRSICFPRPLKVIPKVFHSIIHLDYQSIFPKSTVTTITTT